MDDRGTVSFGELELTSPDVVSWTSENAINEIPTAQISLDGRSPMLRSLALNEPVVILAHEHGVFAGEVVSAHVADNKLVVDCSSAPQMETRRGAAVTKAHHTQIVRLIALDADSRLPEADDDNEICPARTISLDWDALLVELDAAPDFMAFAAVMKSHLSRTKPSRQEQRTVAQILGRVQKEITRSGLAKTPAAEIVRADYAPALGDIWAITWRFRTVPDTLEVIVPLRRIVAPSEPLLVGSVEFVDSDPDAGEFFLEGSDEGLQTDWVADAYARVKVESLDMWSAKQAGIALIREAMAAVGFVYSFSPWQQKLREGHYRPVDYSRPAGAPGVVGRVVRVANLRTGEYWLGPINSTPDPCDLSVLAAMRGQLLQQSASAMTDTELLRHVNRAISWRYRGSLAETPVDAFLYTWVSLEMLFQRPNEKTPDLIRRLPFALLSVGDRPGPIRTELQRRWVPLRDEVVHRAIVSHPDVEEGLRRIRFFSDCAIGYALERAQQSPSYDDWLDHLDVLNRTRPVD